METNKDLEQKIKDEIEIGFKKLNYALKSYNKDFYAEFTSLPSHVGFFLKGPTGNMLVYRFNTLYEAYDSLTEFKKQSIDICSHQKKERH